MAGTAKAQDKGRDSRREGATALDAVKTKAKVEAASAGREADARAAEASKPARAGSGDSPKRQGDKLEKAREAAAGRSGRK
jgi:hypothetical protein